MLWFKSVFLYLIVLLTGARAFLKLSTTIKQLETGYTYANECRHVTILKRENSKVSSTTRCFLPAVTTTLDKCDALLNKTIPKEWRWVINHNGSIDGQVIAVGKDIVRMISLKSCIDRGTAIGRPMRRMYANVGNKSKSTGYVGDFDNLTRRGDSYYDCVFNPSKWWEFKKLNTVDGSTLPLPRNLQQYVRVHTGAHTGVGDFLVPFNFSYSKSTLEHAFRSKLELAIKENRRPSFNSSPKQGKPLVLDHYPFETGISILSTSKDLEGRLIRQITPDTMNVGWNQVLAAITALSSRPDPPQPLPERIKTADLLSIIVLTCLSIVSFRQALNWTVSMRRMSIERWRKKPRDQWIRIKQRSDHMDRTSYFGGSHAQLAGVVIAFLGALVAIAAALLEFNESNLTYREFVTISQGGVITYGPQLRGTSVDPSNDLAGADYVVGHWYVAQVKRVGHIAAFPILLAVAITLVFVVLYQIYFFSLKREHHLDHPFTQFVVSLFRFPVRVLQGLLARILPGSSKFRLVKSYETTFKDICTSLNEQYEGLSAQVDWPSKQGQRPVWQMLKPLKLPYRHQSPRSEMELETDPEDPEPDVGDGETSSFVRPRSLPKNPAQSFHQMRISIGSETTFHQGDVTADEVEKAAAVLAADAYGFLSYPQALTLMAGKTLWKALDRYQAEGSLPSTEEIRHLAMIYYVTEAIIPGNEGTGISGRQFGLSDMGHSAYERPRYAVRDDQVLAPLLGVPDETWTGAEDKVQLNDGIAYALFRINSGSVSPVPKT